MRIAVVSTVISAALALSFQALAAPPPAVSDPVFSDAIAPPLKRVPASQEALANVSHLIYLNRCLPDGCLVTPGNNDSRTNTSSLVSQPVLLPAWPHSQAKWDELVLCVKDLYAPFDITITDVEPGTANHFEVMMAGVGSQLGYAGAGGVAPFVPCDGQLEDNIPSFMFAGDFTSVDFMCWAAAQESAHVFGLDHLLSEKDPMTYYTPPSKKEGFQDVDANCGEYSARACSCGGTTQNSYQYLLGLFGPRQLEPATLAITEPAEGAWLMPGFDVRFTTTSQLSVISSELQVDGVATQTIAQGDPLVFITSPDLAGGEHSISVVATDAAPRIFSSQISVHVMERCSDGTACASGLHCLGGYCLPGEDVAGGFGASCTDDSECISNQCASHGTSMLCTGACDTRSSCPSGFVCSDDGDGQTLCWPDARAADGGGCSTAGGTSPWAAILCLGAIALIGRRRRHGLSHHN